MFDMQLTNNKLINRAVNMVIEATGVDKQTAHKLLDKHGNVRAAVEAYKEGL